MEAGPRSSLRSRKRLFTACLVVLAVTFTLLILRGRQEQGAAAPRWLNAGGLAYRPRKQHRLLATRNETSAESRPVADWAADVKKAALEGVPDDATWKDNMPVEGARGDVTWKNDVPVEGAPGDVTWKNNVPVEGAPGDAILKNDVPVEGAPGDVTWKNDVPVEGAPRDVTWMNNVPVEGAPGDAILKNDVPIEGALDDAILKDDPPLEGAPGDVTWKNDVPVDGALADAAWKDGTPLEGAIPKAAANSGQTEAHSDSDTRLHSSSADVDAVKPVSLNKAKLGDTNEILPNPLKPGPVNPDRTDSRGVQTEDSHDQASSKVTNASEPLRAPSRELQLHTTENVLEQGTTAEPVSYDLCPRCCYRYTTIDRNILVPLNRSEREARGCQRRLPDALIFGVKKGGTTTLRNFLSYHPDVAFAQRELKYFTSTAETARGLEYYRSQMAYAAPGQLAMEKTPAYSHYPKVPALISQSLPGVRLIIIMRDPIQRAVSDYVHMQVTIAKRCGVGRAGAGAGAPSRVTTSNLPPDCAYRTRYEIADTFEGSVLDAQGRVKAHSQLVSKGVYVTDLERYLGFFRRDQILALDGEAFIRDPYPAVKAVERFLGVRDYFAPDFFYFDEQKGFYCMGRPIPENCMNPAKGRPHPAVREDVLRKLREYYRPYNDALRKLVGVDFQWSS